MPYYVCSPVRSSGSSARLFVCPYGIYDGAEGYGAEGYRTDGFQGDIVLLGPVRTKFGARISRISDLFEIPS